MLIEELQAKLRSMQTWGEALAQDRAQLQAQLANVGEMHSLLIDKTAMLEGECRLLRQGNVALVAQNKSLRGAFGGGDYEQERNPIPSVGDDVHIPEDMMRPAQGPEAERTKETIAMMLHPKDDLITRQSREWLDGLKRNKAAQSQAEKQQDMRDDWWLRMPDQGTPSEPITPVDHDLIKTDMQDMAGSIFGFIASFNQDAIDAGLPIFAGEIVCIIHDETMTVRIAKD
jgi:hypothetical protein